MCAKLQTGLTYFKIVVLLLVLNVSVIWLLYMYSDISQAWFYCNHHFYWRYFNYIFLIISKEVLWLLPPVCCLVENSPVQTVHMKLTVTVTCHSSVAPVLLCCPGWMKILVDTWTRDLVLLESVQNSKTRFYSRASSVKGLRPGSCFTPSLESLHRLDSHSLLQSRNSWIF